MNGETGSERQSALTGVTHPQSSRAGLVWGKSGSFYPSYKWEWWGIDCLNVFLIYLARGRCSRIQCSSWQGQSWDRHFHCLREVIQGAKRGQLTLHLPSKPATQDIEPQGLVESPHGPLIWSRDMNSSCSVASFIIWFSKCGVGWWHWGPGTWGLWLWIRGSRFASGPPPMPQHTDSQSVLPRGLCTALFLCVWSLGRS